MPQIPKRYINVFVKWIHDHGIQVRYINVQAKKLKLTQKDINVDKVKDIINNPIDGSTNRIICSTDLFILDGHHRIVAIQNIDPNLIIKVIQVGLSIKKLLDLAHKFPKVKYKDIHEMKEKIKLKKMLEAIQEDNATGEGEVISKPVDSREYIKRFEEFGQIGQQIRSQNYKQLSERIKSLVEDGSTVILSETDSWFDKISVNRDLKLLTDSLKVFEKTCEEMSVLEQRLQSTYDNIGTSLNKYF